MPNKHCKIEEKRLEDLREKAYKDLCEYVHTNCYERWLEIMRLVEEVQDTKFAVNFYSRFGEAANE